jgi:putative salt-induced outer membrane protein YdiY
MADLICPNDSKVRFKMEVKKPSVLVLVCALIMTIFSVAALSQEGATESAPPPDRIVLKNGSTILGTVTATRDGVVSVDTDFAGSLEIAQDQIVAMQTATPAIIQLADGRVLDEQPIVIEDEKIIAGSGASYALTDLAVVNPEPYELGIGYKWSGLANFAWAIERGNSDTDELDYRLDTQWLSADDRYTVRLNGEIDEANEQKSADNWTVIGKYDYFLEAENWYVGLNAAAKQDEFADLDLRYYVGPYVGHQIFDTDLVFLEAELGLAYVNEDFITAPDQDYPGANWNVNASSNYLGGNSRLYLGHVGIWNLDETTDIILNTTIGLAFPLLYNFEAAAEILLEYDSGAVEGIEELDQTYSLRIGYTW